MTYFIRKAKYGNWFNATILSEEGYSILFQQFDTKKAAVIWAEKQIKE